ncbi:MAG: hypothetical protein ACPG8O_07290 [Alcanivorax nanhaiticus]
MRVLAVLLLTLPLSVMLVGLLAAALPVQWSSWLVLMLLLVVALWMVLGMLSTLSERVWPVMVGLVVGNGVAALLLQTTSLYGGGS